MKANAPRNRDHEANPISRSGVSPHDQGNDSQNKNNPAHPHSLSFFRSFPIFFVAEAFLLPIPGGGPFNGTRQNEQDQNEFEGEEVPNESPNVFCSGANLMTMLNPLGSKDSFVTLPPPYSNSCR